MRPGFSDLIAVGMRIEHGLKKDKVANAVGTSNNVKKPPGGFQKKKDKNTNVVSNVRRRKHLGRKQ